MSVKSDGQEWVATVDGKVIGRFPTNREAWLAVDKHNGEAVNKAQDTSDWIFTKGIDQ